MPDSRGGRAYVYAQTALLAAFVAVALLAPAAPDGGAVRIAGGVLLWLGAVGTYFSFRHLGRSLSPYPEPRRRGELVERGLYAVVRHPMYGSMLLLLAGIALLVSVWALAVVAALAVLWWFKAAEEERRLARRYPGYAAYCARVRRRFFPGLL
jgi:protein-S-isoprenylcysteine O-methyltransferase Ste14